MKSWVSANQKNFTEKSLIQLKRGEFFWCDFYEMERLENEICFNNMKVDDTSYDKHVPKSESNLSDFKWCKDFNAGKCTFTTHHNGKFAGQVCETTSCI